ncbi:hypothetical protein [Actinoplanes teichomyceticus]|uniref:Uncharacterized protein n=1 Tax=Actinoplanes teichomyceticus TaxID=1867 RepID=A0A561WA15_ACTTI|nr:hypothetical protein [Actinoplanes teichomyceticus]TWG20705.1 hypothetical protein FHX34_103234 [Actinoplanes teichomyceticus]GIF14361.1 hypothetical protein Ate01nite_43930 [Actinoplanes teichomyceticus]
MVSDVAATPVAVSGRVSLRRAATGAGLALAACSAIHLLGHPVGAFAQATAVLWAVVALYDAADRRCRIAAAGAVVTVAAGWLAAAPLAHAGLPGGIARAALSVLAASQVYAVVTRLGQTR